MELRHATTVQFGEAAPFGAIGRKPGATVHLAFEPLDLKSRVVQVFTPHGYARYTTPKLKRLWVQQNYAFLNGGAPGVGRGQPPRRPDPRARMPEDRGADHASQLVRYRPQFLDLGDDLIPIVRVLSLYSATSCTGVVADWAEGSRKRALPELRGHGPNRVLAYHGQEDRIAQRTV